jgi:tetratricopeptide (TPR) repeat protein
MKLPSAYIARARHAWLAAAIAISCVLPWLSLAQTSTDLSADLAAARQALTGKQYARAKQLYSAFLKTHKDSVDAELGLADAELELHQYEAAEWDYRRVVAAQPQLWAAHKNLVIVEAALGRWEEFERERAVLRAARERGAPGISARESDVIDSFEVSVHGKPQRWIVREYFEPVGRSQARYNFERFSPEGRVQEYISVEPRTAAEEALKPGDVRIGQDGQRTVAKDEFSLNWYTLKAHGTIVRYPKGEPGYERVRRDVLRWLRR